ncbi:hypothetical protein M422DRAFT_51226 [Sphaerobolus stellatus SS14]|uniref:SH3 domain-containing protein n=1 Tax=Sphaerobolus stellatus (strain SS14) TaxID=990650 RepID=A0A0C9UMD6_SPHS4|nr:hypothetical protein M422DRAFT_51226 [Sphaerobolus stellatus SS14]
MTQREQQATSAPSPPHSSSTEPAQWPNQSSLALGDEEPNILSKRMQNSKKTTEELLDFWKERALIEEEYATKLAKLAKASIDSDENGELKESLDTLRRETEKQAQTHLEFAKQVRVECETPTAELRAKQAAHGSHQSMFEEKKTNTQAQWQAQTACVRITLEKYNADCERVNSYIRQAEYMSEKDLERLNAKLLRARECMRVHNEDLRSSARVLHEMVKERDAEWKAFCDSCRDLEEARLDTLKDVLFKYANGVSAFCVRSDESCERIRISLDRLDPLDTAEDFVRDYITGSANHLKFPDELLPFLEGGTPTFDAPYESLPLGPHEPTRPVPPMPPQNPPDEPDNDATLFYVKGLYDYTATIPEEFDFQAGDLIAVTAAPDDGWWSGHLVDESRRLPGKHCFPSNFVCLA